MTDIHDIKPPIETPLPWWILWTILIVLAFIVLIYLLYRFFPKTKEAKKAEKEPLFPLENYHEKALKELKKIQKEFLEVNLEAGYKELSMLLRWFLEQHFRRNFLEMTTEEILADDEMMKHGEESDNLKKILETCDQIKFAKKRGRKEEFKKCISLSVTLIKDLIIKSKKLKSKI